MIEADALGYRLGAILMHNQRPIAYFSQVLFVRARLKLVYEWELMDIVLAIQKYRSYMLGRYFVVPTDQQSLKFLLEQHPTMEEHHY